MTPRANIVIAKVFELIDADNRMWDAQLIHELFLPIDAQRILNIPLAVGMMEDFVFWNLNRSGSISGENSNDVSSFWASVRPRWYQRRQN